MPEFNRVYKKLLRHYGPQNWWPGDSPFEIIVGAVLTQNTAWTNVEKAIANLKDANALSVEAIVHAHPKELANWLTPSGYFNVKAKRLHAICQWLLQQGGEESLQRRDTRTLRDDLLSVYGIGPETADDILLYAFERPVFVIDAYTRRIFSRLGLIPGDESYEAMRHQFESAMGSEVKVLNEYHALIVVHGKDVCRKTARCELCCLSETCKAAIPT
ncbi:MAG: endonuclease III domain-containing protein [Acidiferrobacterales bacterium]